MMELHKVYITFIDGFPGIVWTIYQVHGVLLLQSNERYIKFYIIFHLKLTPPPASLMLGGKPACKCHIMFLVYMKKIP